MSVSQATISTDSTAVIGGIKKVHLLMCEVLRFGMPWVVNIKRGHEYVGEDV
jgi:hypothetical protein